MADESLARQLATLTSRSAGSLHPEHLELQTLTGELADQIGRLR